MQAEIEVLQVKAHMAREMIVDFLKAKLVPMLSGPPGIGKSAIVHDVAQEFNLKVIDLRLAQCDPTDLLGFPTIRGDKSGYLPMETFPVEGDLVPEHFSGWMLFLDEFNSAPLAVQAAAYKLTLDRMVGIYKLHPKVVIVCAGNRENDGAIVQPMSTALQSRLVHMELMVDAKEWNEWAVTHEIDHRITSYIQFKPGNLYTFEPDHTDKTYACPRTWEFASRILKTVALDSPRLLYMLAGTLSQGVAREFLGFCRIYKDLPTMGQILASPKTMTVPKEPSVLWALTGSLAHNAKKENLTKLMEYIMRLPVEFQVVCLREMLRRNRELMATPAMQEWVQKSASDLF